MATLNADEYESFNRRINAIYANRLNYEAIVGGMWDKLSADFTALESSYREKIAELDARPYRISEMVGDKPSEAAKAVRQAERDYLFAYKEASKAAALKSTLDNNLNVFYENYLIYENSVDKVDEGSYRYELNSDDVKTASGVYNPEDGTWTVTIDADVMGLWKIRASAAYDYTDLTGKPIPPVKFVGQSGYDEYISYLDDVDRICTSMNSFIEAYKASILFNANVVKTSSMEYDEVSAAGVKLEITSIAGGYVSAKEVQNELECNKIELSWNDANGLYDVILKYLDGVDVDITENNMETFGLNVDAESIYELGILEKASKNFVEYYHIQNDLGLLESEEIKEYLVLDNDNDGDFFCIVDVRSGERISTVSYGKNCTFEVRMLFFDDNGVLTFEKLNIKKINGISIYTPTIYLGFGDNDFKLTKTDKQLELTVVRTREDGSVEDLEFVLGIEMPTNAKMEVNWDNGEKETLGKIGPAGGYIFYDCDADNTVQDPDGADNLLSKVCGWRYLEAAPNDLRVVNGVPTVDSEAGGYSSGDRYHIFGYHRASSSGDNLYVNGTTVYSGTDCTGTAIGKGESNTEKLVNAMGESAYSEDFGSGKTPDYAARLCSELSHGGYDDWFLPSMDELDLMYDNLKRKGIGSFSDNFDNYWSSSEYSGDADYAWYQHFYYGYQDNSNRYNNRSIRPCRAF